MVAPSNDLPHSCNYLSHRSLDVATILGPPQRRIQEGRVTGPIFRPVTFLVAFGVVLVKRRTGWCVIVDVRVASRMAKSSSQ